MQSYTWYQNRPFVFQVYRYIQYENPPEIACTIYVRKIYLHMWQAQDLNPESFFGIKSPTHRMTPQKQAILR